MNPKFTRYTEIDSDNHCFLSEEGPGPPTLYILTSALFPSVILEPKQIKYSKFILTLKITENLS